MHKIKKMMLNLELASSFFMKSLVMMAAIKLNNQKIDNMFINEVAPSVVRMDVNIYTTIYCWNNTNLVINPKSGCRTKKILDTIKDMDGEANVLAGLVENVRI